VTTLTQLILVQSSPLWQLGLLVATTGVPTDSQSSGLLQEPPFLAAHSWSLGQEVTGLDHLLGPFSFIFCNCFMGCCIICTSELVEVPHPLHVYLVFVLLVNLNLTKKKLVRQALASNTCVMVTFDLSKLKPSFLISNIGILFFLLDINSFYIKTKKFFLEPKLLQTILSNRIMVKSIITVKVTTIQ
jgi:hypothetical protein